MNSRWIIGREPAAWAEQLARALDVPPALAGVLAQRGLSTVEAARRFLDPRLQQLGDPFELPDMGRAVARLLQARVAGETVLLFGDYDVDGVTATALLRQVLAALGWQVVHYLPDRFSEGYGLSAEAVDRSLRGHAISLLIAIDCGSSSAQVVASLAGRGVDVVILDHHPVGEPVPAAVALVNPHRLPDGPGHASGGLCSVGLAFKLAHALVKEGRRQGMAAAQGLDLRSWLDLVALGTVADLVPLCGENRILVSAGLRHLEAMRRPGLEALVRVAGVRAPIGAYEVGYQLAPRLNAAGRLETARGALDLLLSEEAGEALALARQLDVCNRERQNLERRIAAQAIGRIRQRFDPTRDLVLLESDPDWHIGVVGIVASRVVREFHRPAIILGGDGPCLRGSGRSIEGFDLAAALRECDGQLLRHGGHGMAAGVSAELSQLPALRERLNMLAAGRLTPELLQPALRLDGELTLSETTLELVEQLRRLEPVGQANPCAQFAFRGLRVAGPPRRMGDDGQHVKLVVAAGGTQTEALWWGAGRSPLPEGRFDLAAQPQVNEYGGRRSVQLRVLDWQPA